MAHLNEDIILLDKNNTEILLNAILAPLKYNSLPIWLLLKTEKKSYLVIVRYGVQQFVWTSKVLKQTMHF